MSGTTARLFVDDLPGLGEGARRFLLDCKWGTTRLIHVPGPVEITDEQLITTLIYRHGSECGRCNLALLWKRADPEMREAVKRTWRQLGALALRERRN